MNKIFEINWKNIGKGFERQKLLAQGKFNIPPLILQSASYHLRYFLPSRYPVGSLPEKTGSNDILYAGKVETTIGTMMFRMLGIEKKQIEAMPPAFFRAFTAFQLVWRAYDEVVDVAKNTTQSKVTIEELDNTPVYHKYLGRNITGKEGRDIVIQSMNEVIGNGPGSQQRKDRVVFLLDAYRQRIADTANDPRFQNKDVLDYQTALASKVAVTQFLEEISAEFIAIAFDLRNVQEGIELSGKKGLGDQFGDDINDWRKDWKEHEENKLKNQNARPAENLFLATLEEFPQEKEILRRHLNDGNVFGSRIAKILAPKAFKEFSKRYDAILDEYPKDYKYTPWVKSIMLVAFHEIVPLLPDKGKVQQAGGY